MEYEVYLYFDPFPIFVWADRYVIHTLKNEPIFYCFELEGGNDTVSFPAHHIKEILEKKS